MVCRFYQIYLVESQAAQNRMFAGTTVFDRIILGINMNRFPLLFFLSPNQNTLLFDSKKTSQVLGMISIYPIPVLKLITCRGPYFVFGNFFSPHIQSDKYP